MGELPARNEEAEDAFVSDWSRSDDTDALIDVIGAAVAERRPRLAARLVQLLDEHVEIEPGSPLDRARAAAGMFLLGRGTPADRSWSELEEAWEKVHKSRISRAKRRMRDALEGRTDPRGGRGRRR